MPCIIRLLKVARLRLEPPEVFAGSSPPSGSASTLMMNPSNPAPLIVFFPILVLGALYDQLFVHCAHSVQSYPRADKCWRQYCLHRCGNSSRSRPHDRAVMNLQEVGRGQLSRRSQQHVNVVERGRSTDDADFPCLAWRLEQITGALRYLFT